MSLNSRAPRLKCQELRVIALNKKSRQAAAPSNVNMYTTSTNELHMHVFTFLIALASASRSSKGGIAPPSYNQLSYVFIWTENLIAVVWSEPQPRKNIWVCLLTELMVLINVWNFGWHIFCSSIRECRQSSSFPWEGNMHSPFLFTGERISCSLSTFIAHKDH